MKDTSEFASNRVVAARVIKAQSATAYIGADPKRGGEVKEVYLLPGDDLEVVGPKAIEGLEATEKLMVLTRRNLSRENRKETMIVASETVAVTERVKASASAKVVRYVVQCSCERAFIVESLVGDVLKCKHCNEIVYVDSVEVTHVARK